MTPDELPEPTALFRLNKFSPGPRDRKQLIRLASWHIMSNCVFKRWWLPYRVRPVILRAFKATVGEDVVIRHDVDIHLPWKLSLGDSVWLGRGVNIINHAEVILGHDVCISQGATICSSGHDPGSNSFSYKHSKVEIAPHSWIGLNATIMPGVALLKPVVVGGGSVVRIRAGRRSDASPD